MHLSPSPLTASLSRTLLISMHNPSASRPLLLAPKNALKSQHLHSTPTANQTSPFSSTCSQSARKKIAPPKKDGRITLIRYHLHHPTTLTPRPLRFSRTRSLRHWTIHRAWQLFTHQRKAARIASLELQYNAMRDACEELRVGAGDGGRLFRKSMMKTGIWDVNAGGGDGKKRKGKGTVVATLATLAGRGGVPMEYSRGMMDYVGVVDGLGKEGRVWDSGWKR